jgi:choice-of-anchor C domain-containing protein
MRYNLSKALFIGIPVLLWVQNAHASLIINGSFEIPGPPQRFNVPIGSTDIAGWEVINGPLDYVVGGWQASSGIASIDLGGDPGAGGIRQTFSTVPGAIYNVSFDLSGNPDLFGEPSLKTVLLEVAGVSQAFSFDTASEGNTFLDMKWYPYTLQFAASSPTTTISFINTMGTVYTGPAIDNVSVSEVPGPLTALGTIAAFGWSRRLRQRISIGRIK